MREDYAVMPKLELSLIDMLKKVILNQSRKELHINQVKSTFIIPFQSI